METEELHLVDLLTSSVRFDLTSGSGDKEPVVHIQGHFDDSYKLMQETIVLICFRSFHVIKYL